MNKKVLVVDDESSIRDALRKVLQGEDYEVVVAENGLEAIEKFKSEKIDLLLLDLGLPVKDGQDTMRWLGKINSLLPVIIITGRSNQRQLAERLGADVLMEKPLDVPRLLETIRELINQPGEWRSRHGAAGFQYVPCDHQLFLKSLRERFSAPYAWPETKNR